MDETIRADDADLTLMQDRQVAVLGFGNQGAAHALNLRDSGVDVRVGLPEDSRRSAHAEAEGLTVVTPARACADADFIVMLASGHRQAAVYADAVAGHLEPGDALLFTRGSTVRFGDLTPPAGVDVLMVAPQAEGHLVRREYVDGRGVPCLLAVEQDATGVAWDLGAAYAAAIGGLRAGGLRTTFAEEAESRAFGRLAVQDGTTGLVQAGYDTLVDAGYSPQLAYLACLHDLKQTVDELYVGGLASQRGPGAGAGGPDDDGGIVDAAVRARMAQLLDEVRRGQRPGAANGSPASTRRRAAEQAHPIEQVGRELRALMGWIRA